MGTSIIILTYNKLEYTKKCIESIRKYTKDEEYEIIIVDNNSTDGTRSWIENQNDIKSILNKENVGFPAGCNMGIKISKKENDILLLNNDTIVTINWLSNLKKCLYSADNIGAVGPVSNSCPYYQTISSNYENDSELQDFAKDYNKSDSTKWEERQKLIGFCMMIKRKALDKVGLLDEIFSPGNYEDDDYSIRLIKAGYKLYLCNDTFIHHYGSVSFSNNKKYSKMLIENEKKFKDKWGFTSRENMNIYKNYEKLIDKKDPKILEIYCGTGATAMYLKRQFSVSYYGYDDNKNAMEIAINELKDFDTIKLNEDIKFDYVIISNSNKFIKNEKIRRILKSFISFKTNFIINLSEEENNNDFMKNIFSFDLENIYELDDGIKEVNVNSKYLNRYYLIFKNKLSYIEKVKKILNNEIKSECDISEIKKIIRYGILNENHFDYIITNFVSDKISAYNFVSIMAFEEKQYDIIIPLLNKAYNIDNNNLDTIYNLSYVLNAFGECDLALSYLEKAKGKSKEIDELIENIKNNIINN